MRFLSVVIIFTIFVSTYAKYKTYEGYRTYRVYPSNDLQLEMLNKIRDSSFCDFWTGPSKLDGPVDIMVDPTILKPFDSFLSHHGFNYTVWIDNVASIISKPKEVAARNSFDDVPVDGTIRFDRFERYETIQGYLNFIAVQNPEIVTLMSLGKTSEKRDILAVKISSGPGHPAILIDAGIHGREWLAPSLALYMIDQFVGNTNLEMHLTYVDWIFIPVLNPDGYEYTHTRDRFWRKNRAVQRRCTGVDLNRNFGFQWRQAGMSRDECSDVYGGVEPFSELESKAFVEFVKEINKNDTIKMYISLHSYGQAILCPWAYTKKGSEEAAKMKELADQAAKAMVRIGGTVYKVGTFASVLYPSAGTSSDWMAGEKKIPFVYTIELPAADTSRGFDPEPEAILNIVDEAFEGVKIMANYVRTNFNKDKSKK